MNSESKQCFIAGMKGGIPIGLGYFAVSFSLGIGAAKIGMSMMEAGVMSTLMVASAGEFALLDMAASGTAIWQVFLTSLVVNCRYLLMSCALSQKTSSKTGILNRMLVSYSITDEIFGISVAQKGYLRPVYNYGATLVAVPGWVAGTVLGAAMGEVLPSAVTSALSVALYGMFLAIIIPTAKKSRFIAVLVVVSMFMSWLFSTLPVISDISSGGRIMILTIIIAGVAAFVRPIKEREEDEQ